MKFVFLSVPSSDEAWFSLGKDLYLKKISYQVSIEWVELKASRKSRDNSNLKKQEETQLILKYLKNTDAVILFDERGLILKSEAFSKAIEKLQGASHKRLVFIVGGAFGVEEELRKSAQLVISLSSFVLNHQVAVVVALEQIYRALCIQKNLPYHNA